MNLKKDIQLILFDVGGVLVGFSGEETLKQWLQGRLTRRQLWKWYLTSPAVHQFETGKTNPEEFAVAIIDELKLDISVNNFLEEFVTWFQGPFAGVQELLLSMKSQFSLATLSNTNELLWPMFAATEIYDAFHMHFPSHQVGLIKPDPRIYHHVVESTGIKAEHILFFDDSPINIKAAKSSGLLAFRVRGAHQLRKRLIKLGLYPGESL